MRLGQDDSRGCKRSGMTVRKCCLTSDRARILRRRLQDFLPVIPRSFKIAKVKAGERQSVARRLIERAPMHDCGKEIARRVKVASPSGRQSLIEQHGRINREPRVFRQRSSAPLTRLALGRILEATRFRRAKKFHEMLHESRFSAESGDPRRAWAGQRPNSLAESRGVVAVDEAAPTLTSPLSSASIVSCGQS